MLLNHIKKFTTLTKDEAGLIEQTFRALRVKKKTILLREGDPCRSLYFTAKGCLRMYFINNKGTEQITQFAIENWWLADQFSFERQEPAHFFIQAIEDCELLCLDHSAYDGLLQNIPALEHYFRIIYQRVHAAAQQRTRYESDYSREEMYLFFTKAFPEFVQRIPQYMLASYLGFTPEYLSEIRKKHTP